MRDCRKSDRLLLVEGENDLHVFLHLKGRLEQDEGLGSMPEFCIDDKGAIDPLLESITNEVRVPDRRAVGIVVDADQTPPDRWDAVADRLREVGIAAPEEPVPGGTCIPESTHLPRIGIWLMPDNGSPGELEEFVRTMLPDGDPVWPSSKRILKESARSTASSGGRCCTRKSMLQVSPLASISGSRLDLLPALPVRRHHCDPAVALKNATALAISSSVTA